MDPVTHTLTGWSLGRAGLDRLTPLAIPTLVVAANAPDVDVLAYLEGEYFALAFRRGWTHGVLAWLVLPLLVWGIVLMWDRWIRRRLRPGGAPARAGPLLLVATVGVLTHPALDWLNTYGIRLLMPFDERWFYGDALFIADPWLWLFLAGGLFLGGTWRRGPLTVWLAFWLLATFLLWWGSPPAPSWALPAWGAALIVLLVARWLRARREARRAEVRARERNPAPLPGEIPTDPPVEVAGWPARVGVTLAAGYVISMIALSLHTEMRVLRPIADRIGTPEGGVLSAPRPADPFTRDVVIASRSGYRFGRHTVDGGLRIDPGLLPLETGEAAPPTALEDPDLRSYLVWARFPVVEVSRAPGGTMVRVGDARYAHFSGSGSLSGVTVWIPAASTLPDASVLPDSAPPFTPTPPEP